MRVCVCVYIHNMINISSVTHIMCNRLFFFTPYKFKLLVQIVIRHCYCSIPTQKRYIAAYIIIRDLCKKKKILRSSFGNFVQIYICCKRLTNCCIKWYYYTTIFRGINGKRRIIIHHLWAWRWRKALVKYEHPWINFSSNVSCA